MPFWWTRVGTKHGVLQILEKSWFCAENELQQQLWCLVPLVCTKGRSSDAFLIVNATSKMQLIISQYNVRWIYISHTCCSSHTNPRLWSNFFFLSIGSLFSLPINNNIDARGENKWECKIPYLDMDLHFHCFN